MRLAEGLFVTGTDTGVGKTVVTASLAAALRVARVDVRALKAVETGGDADARALGAAAGHAPRCFASLRTPISPHRAAALDGVALRLPELVAWIHAQAGAVTLVEGAGGWRVPLGWTTSMADLARALGWPVLVVARDRLGTLNHTLLTVDAVRACGLAVAGVVLSERGDDASVATNREDLERLLPDVAVRGMPRVDPRSADDLRRAGQGLLLGGGGTTTPSNPNTTPT